MSDRVGDDATGTISVPDRVVTRGSVFPRDFIAARGLLSADWRPGGLACDHIDTAQFQRRTRSAAVALEIIVISNLVHFGRYKRLNDRRRRTPAGGNTDHAVAIQILMET